MPRYSVVVTFDKRESWSGYVAVAEEKREGSELYVESLSLLCRVVSVSAPTRDDYDAALVAVPVDQHTP